MRETRGFVPEQDSHQESAPEAKQKSKSKILKSLRRAFLPVLGAGVVGVGGQKAFSEIKGLAHDDAIEAAELAAQEHPVLSIKDALEWVPVEPLKNGPDDRPVLRWGIGRTKFPIGGRFIEYQSGGSEVVDRLGSASRQNTLLEEYDNDFNFYAQNGFGNADFSIAEAQKVEPRFSFRYEGSGQGQDLKLVRGKNIQQQLETAGTEKSVYIFHSIVASINKIGSSLVDKDSVKSVDVQGRLIFGIGEAELLQNGFVEKEATLGDGEPAEEFANWLARRPVSKDRVAAHRQDSGSFLALSINGVYLKRLSKQPDGKIKVIYFEKK